MLHKESHGWSGAAFIYRGVSENSENEQKLCFSVIFESISLHANFVTFKLISARPGTKNAPVRVTNYTLRTDFIKIGVEFDEI